MEKLTKTQIATIEKIGVFLGDFKGTQYMGIVSLLLDQYKLSKHRKVMDSIYADFKNKKEYKYATKFAKKYNLK